MGHTATLEEAVDLDAPNIKLMESRLELFVAYVKHNLSEEKRRQLEISHDFIHREGVGMVCQVTLGFTDDPPGCEKGFIVIGTYPVADQKLTEIIRKRAREMADFLIS